MSEYARNLTEGDKRPEDEEDCREFKESVAYNEKHPEEMLYGEEFINALKKALGL